MMSAFVMQMMENDLPEYAGDTLLLRGDNVSAVSWLNRCGGHVTRRYFQHAHFIPIVGAGKRGAY